MSDDHLIQKYYEAEMRYLREAGKEFAQAYPDRARYLNLDRVGDRDPYVERLFEGFAFLTGRVRQKLDDELPELTEGLVSMLWPHYLRMIPSLAILELTPDANDIQKAEEIPAGLAVRSSPVGPTGTQCLYRTTQNVNIQPISLIEASANTQADGRSVLRMRFELSPQARRADLDLSRIRLYLDADTPVVSALYLALSQHVQSSQCRIAEVAGGAAQQLSGIHFESVGFSQQEKLWPSADQAFSGYQLLLEYFTFPEKFRFLDLCGFSIDSIPADSRQFDLEFVLKQSYPNDLAFSAQNIRLFCTPVINLFSLESDPLRVSHLETEYRVVPMAQYGSHVETYSVDEVISLDQSSGLRNDYVPFSSFKHRGGMMRHDAPERYFHTRTRKGASGMNETWLSLGGHLWESLDKLPAETLSLRVTGTHGQLPRKALRDSSINTLMGSANKVKSVRNLTSPTMPCYPPVGDRFQWRVLSHLAPNYLSLLDAEILRGTLALYDWTDNELNRRRIEGVSHVQFSEIQKMSRGGLIYGVAIEVTLQSSHFTGEGDVFLFGELLQHFFAEYAEINLFVQLTVLQLPSGKRHTWTAQHKKTAPF